MAHVWTCHFVCFHCDKEFIVNRLSLGAINATAGLFPCPNCLKAPTPSSPHRMNYVVASNLPYRKKAGGEVWHYSEYCSEWPAEDFVEIEYPPADEICNECRALAGT